MKINSFLICDKKIKCSLCKQNIDTFYGFDIVNCKKICFNCVKFGLKSKSIKINKVEVFKNAIQNTSDTIFNILNS